jgi:hypothetical protein
VKNEGMWGNLRGKNVVWRGGLVLRDASFARSSG